MSSSTASDNFLKVAYFASIAGVSILVGFSTTLSRLRKDPAGPPSLQDEGVALARKALGRATLYSICGFGVFALTSYQLFGKELIERKSKEYRAARERESDLPAEIREYFVSSNSNNNKTSSNSSKNTNSNSEP